MKKITALLLVALMLVLALVALTFTSCGDNDGVTLADKSAVERRLYCRVKKRVGGICVVYHQRLYTPRQVHLTPSCLVRSTADYRTCRTEATYHSCCVAALCDGTLSYMTGESLILDGGMHIRRL